MLRIFTVLLFLCAALTLVAPPAVADDHDHDDHAEPSECAKGMPGALGTIVFEPDDWMEGETTYWIDTDGIAPSIAGCHVGTDADGERNGRKFGEACVNDKVLVESNPGAYAVHAHANDLGHPDTFDCHVWCMETEGTAGKCTPVGAVDVCEESAKCTCG